MDKKRRRRFMMMGGSGGASPSDLGGLVAWYDFSDRSTLFQDTARTNPVTADGQSIAGVTDKSSSGWHLSQATAANQPTYKENIFNGKSVARCDGTTDVLTNTAVSVTQPNTMFIVAKASVLSIAHYMIDGITSRQAVFINSDNTLHMFTTGGADVITHSGVNTNIHIYIAVFNGASSLVYRDGVAGTVVNPGAGAMDDISVAARLGGSNWFTGDMCEVGVYSGSLSSASRDSLELYLGTKWGVTVS